MLVSRYLYCTLRGRIEETKCALFFIRQQGCCIIKHSYEENVVNLNFLSFLFHSKFQKVKITFLRNTAFTHNIITEYKMSLRAGLYFACWIKGITYSVNHQNNLYRYWNVSSNTNEDTLFNPRFNQPLHSSARSSMHIVQLYFHALVNLPSQCHYD